METRAWKTMVREDPFEILKFRLISDLPVKSYRDFYAQISACKFLTLMQRKNLLLLYKAVTGRLYITCLRFDVSLF